MKINIEHTKRPIIKVNINGKDKFALLDTGASVSILSDDIEKGGRAYGNSVVGAGGGELKLYYPKSSTVDIWGIRLTNFLVGDISDIRQSIKSQTGIKIDMIIGTPDIKSAEMKIDLYNNVVKLGE